MILKVDRMIDIKIFLNQLNELKQHSLLLINIEKSKSSSSSLSFGPIMDETRISNQVTILLKSTLGSVFFSSKLNKDQFDLFEENFKPFSSLTTVIEVSELKIDNQKVIGTLTF